MEDQMPVRGKSLVNVIPRNNNVLIKMEFVESVLAITSGNKQASLGEKVKFTVAGIGPHVKDLELGETICFGISREYKEIPIKGNDKSILALQDFYSKLSKTELAEITRNPDTNRVNVVQYGMFVEYEIPGHIL